MKKLLLFIGAVTIMSCSNDPIEFNNNVANPKIVAENVPGINASLPNAWEVELVGNILNKIKINTSQEDTFTYSGGKLVEVNHFSNSMFNGVDEFSYNTDGSIQKITSKNTSLIITTTRIFDYSDPNFIEENVTNYNASGDITSQITIYKKIDNGNLVQYNVETNQLNNFNYDNKENVFSNLEYLNELVLYYSNDIVGKNNRISSNCVFNYSYYLPETNVSYINLYNESNKIVKRSVIYDGVEEYKQYFTYN